MLPIFVSAIAASDDRNFAEKLYEQHKGKIYKTAYKILNDIQDAEDATSESFMKIMDNIQDYYHKSEDELASIFVAIAKNSAIDRYRRKNKIEFAPMPEDYSDGGEFEDNVGDFVVKQELYENLSKAVDLLGEDYSSVVKLKIGYNCSYYYSCKRWNMEFCR